MREGAGAPPGPAVLTAALDRLRGGVVVLALDWTARYVNPAGARLLGATVPDLTGRDVREVLPGLRGSLFHAFLLHARVADTTVAWQGFHAPTGRWLDATAEVRDGLVHVSFREVPPRPAGEGAPDPEHDRLLYLAEVSEAMITSLETGVSADRLAGLLVPRLCDWATVVVLGEDGAPDRTGRAHRDPDRLADLDTYLGERTGGARDQPALAAAMVSGAPVQLRSIDADVTAGALPTEEVRQAWARLDATSCVFVPLQSRGITFGAISLVNSGGRPPHTEREIAVALDVARRGALAIDNTRLYARQLEVAETLQRSLLPRAPRHDRLQIAGRYRPAGSRALVGGDFHDAFELGDGRTVAVIGDVVGHNLAAAAAMGRLASTVRALAYDRADGPARTLARVDRVLTDLDLGVLATALVAHIGVPGPGDPPAQHPVTWSSAGHPPPALLRADGSVEVLRTPPERLLGIPGPTPRTDHSAVLHRGDTLVLYTDGLVEHRRADLDTGTALLGRIMVGRSDDDVAILAVRCAD